MTENEAIGRLIDHFVIHKDNRPTPYLDEAKYMAIEALEEIQQYRAIGTVEEYLAAVEKQKAKKPIEKIKLLGIDKGGKCPSCQKYVNSTNYWAYCSCGQKLDWSNDEVTDMENLEVRR